MGNVIALPTRPNDEQPWQCRVCRQIFSYSQPINFQLQLAMLKLFMVYHNEHCQAPEAGKEPAGC